MLRIVSRIRHWVLKVPRKVFAEGPRGRYSSKVDGFCGRFLRKAFAEGSAEGFFLPMLKIILFFNKRFRGRFLRKVLWKVFAEGSVDVFVEGVCERFFRGRFPEGFRKDSGRF